ncbi:MAG: FAD-binding protein [Clostridia bacterium]|nr:FAD-binding protein [Clostridia bacterium]
MFSRVKVPTAAEVVANLVIGGGLGGCLAAIKARDQGVNVILMEKAALRRSGNAATGLQRIPLIHPDYNMSWEDFAVRNAQWGEIVDEDLSYFFPRDSLGIVNDLEEWGIKVRLWIWLKCICRQLYLEKKPGFFQFLSTTGLITRKLTMKTG